MAKLSWKGGKAAVGLLALQDLSPSPLAAALDADDLTTMEEELMESSACAVAHVCDLELSEAEFTALYQEKLDAEVPELQNAKCPVKVPEPSSASD